jgi:hypothetical protein
MKTARALQTLQSLVEGKNPLTDAELPHDSVLQNAEVLRALLAAIAALDQQARREERRSQLPPNVGRDWTEAEEATLVAAFKDGEVLDAIAQRHGRTLRAIESRLEKLGLLPPEKRSTADFGTPENVVRKKPIPRRRRKRTKGKHRA